MTDFPELSPVEEADVLAAELALGLLDGDELSDAQARLRSDPDFHAAFRDWTERLAVLADDLTPVMAPARAKVMVDRALGHAAPVQLQDAAAAPARFMRWLYGAVAVAAVILTIIYLPHMLRFGPGSNGAQYSTELVSADQNLRVSAALNPDTNVMQIALAEGAVPDGNDYELWWIADADSAPVSLGLVPRGGSVNVQVPDGLTRTEATVLALSEEPTGGSPTGQPTGQIIATAPITTL